MTPEPAGRRAWTSALIGHRGRGVLRAGAWSLLAKAAATANLLVSVPFALSALGPAEFGAWAALVSFMTLAGFLDFGLGNGTMNLVAGAHGRNAPEEVAVIVQEGWRAMRRIALALMLPFLALVVWLPWQRLLGLPEALSGEARLAAGIVLGSVLLAVPLGLAARVHLGVGRGDRAFRWQVAGNLVGLLAVMAATSEGGQLALLTAASMSAPLLAGAGSSLALLREKSATAQSRSHVDTSAIARHIHREGALFFVLQLSAAAALSFDLVLITSLRGAEEAGVYVIVQRLFSLAPIALALLWIPLWPTYRHALAAGDHAWVKRTLQRSLWLAFLLSSATAACIALGFETITGVWLGQPLQVDWLLLAGFGIWCTLESSGAALATFLNAASAIRVQAWLGAAFAATSLLCKVWLLMSAGSQALPLATAACYLATTVIPLSLLMPAILRNSRSRNY